MAVLNCPIFVSSNLINFPPFFLKEHKRVLDKHGKPDDVPMGIKNVKEPLPHTPISGMYNKSGGKVRLTFKLEVDQLWLGTKGWNHSRNLYCNYGR